MTPQAACAAAFARVREAVSSGKIPGAALGLVTASGKRAVLWEGLAQREPASLPLTRDLFFDLASLTKVIFTTTEIMRLLEAGRLDLDDTLARHIPDLFQYDPAHRLRRITLRDCLTHRTGLPAVEPIYSWGSDPATLRALVLQKDWRFGADVYSDINFILLGIVLERLTGTFLPDWNLPAGLAIGPAPERSVATERCAWRGRVMRGAVHDENAFSLGGMAGHAGLFGTVDGVLDFAAALLRGSLLSAAGTALLRRPATPRRCLGWEHAYLGWSGGSLCSEETLGHTGFTGTGLWIDFARGYAWTLLTNRVHPSRHVETGIAALRQAVGNSLAAAMTTG